nr:GTP 3',8-cyclase MoaA [Rubritalea marina]
MLKRPMRDLRISVTDRCNFRCRYCMPIEIFDSTYEYLPREGILNFDEIERFAEVFAGQGGQKLRITGGEPLLRRDLPILIEKLSSIDGIQDIAMTTNASLLAKHAEPLRAAGLDRVTVSLDALDEEVFGAMNGVGAKPQRVIDGIDAAIDAGLGVKINSVVQKGTNEGELIGLAHFARERRVPIRYIEYMDTGNTNGWKLDHVVPSAEVHAQLAQHFTLESVGNPKLGETAQRFADPSAPGFEVGFISSVTKPFCRDCNRMRLSADGHLYTCLFASEGYDMKSPMRAGESNAELADRLVSLWGGRHDRYSELRSEGKAGEPKKEMSYLGG